MKIGHESLRKLFDIIQSYLPCWIDARLTFREAMGEDWKGQKVLWEALGVEAETTLLSARTLEYQFLDGRIMVSNVAANTPMLTSGIVACLTTAWRFVKWIDFK